MLWFAWWLVFYTFTVIGLTAYATYIYMTRPPK